MLRFFMLCLAMSTATAQDLSEEQLRDMLGPQSRLMIDESLSAGQAYARLIKGEPSSSVLLELGAYFSTTSKHLHAMSCFEKVLTQDKENAEAKAGLENARNRVQYLAGRLTHFEADYQKTKNYQSRCSQAAILFHLGKPREGIQIITELLELGEDNQEIRGLRYSFQQSFFLKKMALEQLAASHRNALTSKDLDLALTTLGQMIFISMGELPADPYFQRLVETFPEQIEKNKIAKLTETMIDWKVGWPETEEG